ncbi:MAG: hypothetical protein V8S95_08195 [Odoribacter sp.]
MKITKLILPLVLGLTGGLIAIFITDGLKSENKQPVLQHDIAGPGMTRKQTQSPAGKYRNCR